MLKKINKNVALSDSKLIRHSLTGMDATTQTLPTFYLFRSRELNEEETAAGQTFA
uniref:SERPIN domain-containing protein n=1 Tax=Elaeophora elaphi TaxID=1147741 RepID=A0A0R3RLG8_9BILA